MPRLRDTDDIDVEALEAIEYSTEEYSSYAGEVPPIGLELIGYVKKMWWTRTAPKPGGGGDDPMLKILWVASDNDGDLAAYNECPFWLNAPLVPGAKFRWDPFLLAYGLTLTEVKTKTYVAKDEDQNGLPIERIGTWHPGADRDEAWCRIITGQEPYNGIQQARVAEWIAWDAEEVPEDGEDEPEDIADEDEDEDYEDEDEEGEEEGEDEPEDEPEPEPPARTRRTSARTTSRTAPAKPARTASRPATAKTGSRTRSTPAKAAPATTARSSRSSGRAAPARSAGKPAAGRRGGKPASNEPPF